MSSCTLHKKMVIVYHVTPEIVVQVDLSVTQSNLIAVDRIDRSTRRVNITRIHLTTIPTHRGREVIAS